MLSNHVYFLNGYCWCHEGDWSAATYWRGLDQLLALNALFCHRGLSANLNERLEDLLSSLIYPKPAILRWKNRKSALEKRCT